MAKVYLKKVESAGPGRCISNCGEPCYQLYSDNACPEKLTIYCMASEVVFIRVPSPDERIKAMSEKLDEVCK